MDRDRRSAIKHPKDHCQNSRPFFPPSPAAEGWTQLATGAFRACYGFSYVCSALYMLFTLILLIFQKAVTKE